MFGQLKKRIMQQRQIYFPNDPLNPVLISIENVINDNIRRNMREIMAEHFSFATTTQYKSEYLMNENA